MNSYITKGSRLKSVAYGALISAAAVGSSFAVGLDTAAAEAGITDAVTKGTTVIIAGFAIGVVFMVAKVIRRGMRSAG